MVTQKEYDEAVLDQKLSDRAQRSQRRNERWGERRKNMAQRRESRKQFWKEGRLGKGLKYTLDSGVGLAKNLIKETGRVATDANFGKNLEGAAKVIEAYKSPGISKALDKFVK